MLPLSYNISYDLKKKLDSIDELRQRILLTPIQPKFEHKLKWDLLLKRIHYAFQLVGQDLSISTIVKIINSGTKISKYNPQQIIYFYQRAFIYISEEWTANPSPITFRTLQKLESILTGNNERSKSYFQKSEQALSHLLEYLQTQPDHPVVLAAISYIKILDIKPSVQNNELLAQLVALLFIFKYGFDVKDFTSFEAYFYKNIRTYENVINEVMAKNRLTLWLEYFAIAVENQLLKVAQYVSSPPAEKTTNLMWKLSERQKEILHKLDQPGSTMTNRSVQKMFGISQITASRDLSKLSTLGFILTHGKGRSIYYIKS